MELRIANSALGDLRGIQDHYNEQNIPNIGSKFVVDILAQCEMLKLHPNAGRTVPEFGIAEIRELIHAPFRIVYLRQPDEIILIRVWRSERQLVLPDLET